MGLFWGNIPFCFPVLQIEMCSVFHQEAHGKSLRYKDQENSSPSSVWSWRMLMFFLKCCYLLWLLPVVFKKERVLICFKWWKTVQLVYFLVTDQRHLMSVSSLTHHHREIARLKYQNRNLLFILKGTWDLLQASVVPPFRLEPYGGQPAPPLMHGPYFSNLKQSDLGQMRNCFGFKYFSVLNWSCQFRSKLQIHRASSVKCKNVFESKEITYLTQVWKGYSLIKLQIKWWRLTMLAYYWVQFTGHVMFASHINCWVVISGWTGNCNVKKKKKKTCPRKKSQAKITWILI